MFDSFEVIHRYTVDDAIRDGALIHPYPERFPWILITPAVHGACQPTERDERTYDQKLLPLITDAVWAARAASEWPAVLYGTVADKVWIAPNERGGITIMTPDEY